MKTANLKIGVRLGAGFGIVLTLMGALIAVGLIGLAGIGAINDRVIREEWVKANAAHIINATAATNGRLTLQTLLTSDPDKIVAILHEIDNNAAGIDKEVGTLEKLIHSDEGKARLARLKETRASFRTSRGKVASLLGQGQRDQTMALMTSETLPALDSLQAAASSIVELQRRFMEERGAEAKSDIDSARALMLLLGLAAVVIGIGCAYAITRSITRPLHQAVQVAQTVASGDLTSRIQANGSDETSQLLRALGLMNESLRKIVGEVRTGTDTIATASGQIAQGNIDLSSRTEEQAASLEETASSMTQLTETVRQNADNAQQANTLAAHATEMADAGNEAMRSMVSTIEKISGSSTQISDITGVIEGIAFQTNILALNAAVEAARAGEQGRGFAVVASEVRSLAQRSAAAAKEIKGLIGSSVATIRDGATQAEEVGTTIGQVKEAIKRVSDIVGEIAAASEEQRRGIEQVNQAVVQMDEVTQQNAALVEEAAAAAQSLEEQARHLTTAVSVFKLADACSAELARVAQSRPHVAVRKEPTTSHAPKAIRPPASAMAGVAKGALERGGVVQDWQTF
ncbi:methyl-accepting chemotaxis protein [Ralstonia insidiosa]|uniref:methyl-accepting chemotaxis protein n=1 Tax=Ralstonia insidiosa TaxID=190721 RepID=UPI000CEDE288|nr:methyl-accepting chemotaxis protein [Ralstonia insidiosa]